MNVDQFTVKKLGRSLSNQLLAQATATAVLAVLSLVAFSIWQKNSNLKQNLEISAATVASSLEESDWQLTIDHLARTAKAGGLESIVLDGPPTLGRILGPLGIHQFGVIRLCDKQPLRGSSYILSACTTALGLEQILYLFAICVFYFLACWVFVRFSDRSTGMALSQLQLAVDSITLSLKEGRPLEGANQKWPELTNIQNSIVTLLNEVQAVEQHKAVALMASRISHDIRNPLTAIRIGLSALSTNSIKATELIEKGCASLEGLSKEMLQGYRKSMSSTPPIGEDRGDLQSEIRSFLADQKEIGDGSFEIGFQRLQTGPVLVALSPLKIRRILENLCRNSKEAKVQDRKLRVQVSLELLSGGKCRLSFADNAMGIPSNVLPRIFDDGFTFGKCGGTGLGLGFVSSEVRASGGEISVSSAIGEGTTFHLDLPIYSETGKL